MSEHNNAKFKYSSFDHVTYYFNSFDVPITYTYCYHKLELFPYIISNLKNYLKELQLQTVLK